MVSVHENLRWEEMRWDEMSFQSNIMGLFFFGIMIILQIFFLLLGFIAFFIIFIIIVLLIYFNADGKVTVGFGQNWIWLDSLKELISFFFLLNEMEICLPISCHVICLFRILGVRSFMILFLVSFLFNLLWHGFYFFLSMWSF